MPLIDRSIDQDVALPPSLILSTVSCDRAGIFARKNCADLPSVPSFRLPNICGIIPNHMKIFVPKQSDAGETRVALVPAGVKKIPNPNVQVLIESSAGLASSHTDEAYKGAGAQIV